MQGETLHAYAHPRMRFHVLMETTFFTFTPTVAERDEAGLPRRFEGVAYSGGVIPGYGWHGDAAIDLSTMELPQGQVFALVDHDPGKRAGKLSARLVGNQVLVSGEFFTASDAGKEVAALFAEGAPWQMSVGIQGKVENGDRRSIELNGRALSVDTIFRNAVQTAYGAGHWRRFEETKDDQPYLMYDAVNDSRTRPAHRALDGIIRPVDDPFWLTHSPPMGHNCRCTLIQLDAEQAEIRSRNGRGLNQPETPEMRGDDDGWGRKPMQWDETLQWLIEKKGNECQAFSFAGKRKSPPVWCNSESYARVLRASMEGYNKAGGGMPEPRSGAGIERLTSRDPDGLFRRFMREFDGPEYADAIGNVLRIDYQLFESLAGRTKVLKGERAKWLVFTALNIREPDEIWLELGRQGGADKLYYLSRFDVGMRESLACIAVFERHHDAGGQWTGRTNYATTQRGYMDRKRNRDLLHGELKYWRWE